MSGRRTVLLFLALAILAIVVALPVLAASPSPLPGAAAPTAKPEATKGPHPTKGPQGPESKDKDAKQDEVAVTLKGRSRPTTDAAGETTYTLQSGGKTYTLEAGPPWFFGDAYPLKPYAGKSVTITGETATGSTDVDVLTVDAPGAPCAWQASVGRRLEGRRRGAPRLVAGQGGPVQGEVRRLLPAGPRAAQTPEATPAPTP